MSDNVEKRFETDIYIYLFIIIIIIIITRNLIVTVKSPSFALCVTGCFFHLWELVILFTI